jgi:hypothetical protein
MKCKKNKRLHCQRRPAPKAKKSSTAKIGTWNLFNGSRVSALAEYAKFCEEYGISILAVQETKRKSKTVEDWYFEGNLS